MKTSSLTTRTVLAALAAQLICAFILCTAALLHEFHTRLRSLDAQIQGRSDSLLGAVQDAEDADANVTIDPAELKIQPQDVFAVYNQGGRMLGSSSYAPPALISRAQLGYRDLRLAHENYRILQRDALRVIDRADNGGVGLRRPVTIIYAMPEGHLRHEVFEAASFYIVTILLATGAMAFLLPILIRKTLRPLTDLAAATLEMKPPSFVFRAPSSATQLNELRPLTDGLNQSIERVRESFAREQQFVGDAAHELKTAVTVIRSSVQLLLLKRRSEAEYQNGLERIVDDVERLQALIGQMLELARIEEDSQSITPLIDLGETVDTVVALLVPVAEEKDVHMVVDAPHGWKIFLRGEFAEALISNLVLNALQHSSHASQTIQIALTQEQQDTVTLRVSDHGTGIAPENLPHIFERFYREDNSRSRETGGTGLGLAIAKSIVDNAGGRIQVRSKPGAGTTMLVTFMLA